MRPFILIAAVVAAIFFWNRNSDEPAKEAAPAPATVKTAAASTVAAPSPAPEASQAKHWPKRSIDRAREVANKTRQNSLDAQR